MQFQKIESLADLPTKQINCWFVVNEKKEIGIYSPQTESFYNNLHTNRFSYSQVSHFVEIPEPETPIF